MKYKKKGKHLMIFVIHIKFNSKILPKIDSIDPFATSIEYIYSDGLIARMCCQKQPFADLLQIRFSHKLRNIYRKENTCIGGVSF